MSTSSRSVDTIYEAYGPGVSTLDQPRYHASATGKIVQHGTRLQLQDMQALGEDVNIMLLHLGYD